MKHHPIRSFNGVRALSLGLIVLFHIAPTIFRSGYLMVNVFFILSGFLLTKRLNDRQIHLTQYFLTKIKDLWVRLVLMMGIFLLIFYAVDASLLVDIRNSSISALTFTYHWFSAMSDRSYFDALTSVELWTHLWYLGVHVQSFLIFTVLFAGFRKMNASLSLKIGVVSMLTVFSMFWMSYLYLTLNQPLDVYFYTSSRMFAFGLGSIAALLPLDKIKISSSFTMLVSMILLGFLGFYQFSEAFLYLGGMQIFSVVALLWIVSLTKQDQKIAKFLSHPKFTWLSTYSFEAYLYSYPLTILMNYILANASLWMRIIVTIALLILILWIFSKLNTVRFKPVVRRLALLVLVGLILVINPQKDPQTLALEEALKQQQKEVDEARVFSASVQIFAKSDLLEFSAKKQEELRIEQEKLAYRRNVPDLQHSKQAITTKATYSDITAFEKAMALTPKQMEYFSKLEVSMIGDSIMLGALPAFEKTFPTMVMDASVGRQMYHIEPVLDGLLASDRLYEIVIIHLGNNATFLDKYFDIIMEKVGERQVFIVNTRLNKKVWESEVNTKLKKFTDRYDTVHLINWKQFANHQSNIFYRDQEHLTPKGQEIYKDFIAHNILVQFAK